MARKKQRGESNLDRSAADLVPLAQDIAIDRANKAAEAACWMAVIRGLQTDSTRTGSSGLLSSHAAVVQGVTATGGKGAAHFFWAKFSQHVSCLEALRS